MSNTDRIQEYPITPDVYLGTIVTVENGTAVPIDAGNIPGTNILIKYPIGIVIIIEKGRRAQVCFDNKSSWDISTQESQQLKI